MTCQISINYILQKRKNKSTSNVEHIKPNIAKLNGTQTFSGTKNFNNTISCTLDRVGDLVSRMYLKVIIPSVTIPNPNFISTFNPNDQNDINNLQIQYTNLE